MVAWTPSDGQAISLALLLMDPHAERRKHTDTKLYYKVIDENWIERALSMVAVCVCVCLYPSSNGFKFTLLNIIAI